MIRLLLKIFIGRDYEKVSFSDFSYLLKKGLSSKLRGFFFSLLRFQLVPGLMIGKNVSFIAPKQTKFGKGVFIGANSYIELYSSKSSYIGKNVTIRECAWVQCRSGLNNKAYRLIIEDDVYIGPSSVIGVGGEVLIEKNCRIGARLTISAEEHVVSNGNYVSNDVERQGIRIKENCWLGNNVTILDGVTIGKNSVIGACSIVTKDIPENSVAYGVPAKVVRQIK
jgi:acetyltransferase-like isoleucine patch superfamily enzyme